MNFRFTLYPSEEVVDVENPLVLEAEDGTLIDNNSHGPAALGGLKGMEVGEIKAIICSPNVVAFTVERTD